MGLCGDRAAQVLHQAADQMARAYPRHTAGASQNNRQTRLARRCSVPCASTSAGTVDLFLRPASPLMLRPWLHIRMLAVTLERQPVFDACK